MDAILNNSKRSMMPAGHHSDSDYTLLPLPKSAITWFGGIFARSPPLAARLKRHYAARIEIDLRRLVCAVRSAYYGVRSINPALLVHSKVVSSANRKLVSLVPPIVPNSVMVCSE